MTVQVLQETVEKKVNSDELYLIIIYISFIFLSYLNSFSFKQASLQYKCT